MHYRRRRSRRHPRCVLCTNPRGNGSKLSRLGRGTRGRWWCLEMARRRELEFQE